jgi:putative NADPH-quinone reductase
MAKKVAIIDGHPDPAKGRYCHALANAYADGAAAAGHEVRWLVLADLDIPMLRTRAEWEQPSSNEAIVKSQDMLRWADHLVIIFPLWLGSLPALLKAFFEQVLRPGFAFEAGASMRPAVLSGKSARIVVTMGMPSLIYRWYFGSHSLKSLERNILKFVGIRPVRATLIGSIESGGAPRHKKFLEKVRQLGARAV